MERRSAGGKGHIMTEQQSDDDLLASLVHALRQRRQAARSWQALSEQHEATIQAQREALDRQERASAELRAALERYTNADDCEYGAGPPCPGDVGVPQCMYCQARAALAARNAGEGET